MLLVKFMLRLYKCSMGVMKSYVNLESSNHFISECCTENASTDASQYGVKVV